jgi:Tfp pilus assembly protein PilZ
MPSIGLVDRPPKGSAGDDPERRRSGRVLAPVPIQIIGQDATGRSFIEEAFTVSINQQGARISLIHSLIPDDVVFIKNLQNGIEEEFRVVGGFQQVIGDRREWGVEALDRNGRIWGVEFTPPENAEQLKALIECAACHKAALSPLSSMEYEVLLSTGAISRHCDRCDQTTRWKPSRQSLTPEMIADGDRLAAVQEEKRKERRQPLTVGLKIRDSRGSSYAAETRDVSKNGLCFATAQQLQVGEEVFVTFPFSDRTTPVERRCRIMWAAISSNARVYGVFYLK